MKYTTEQQCDDVIFASYLSKPHARQGLDQDIRDPQIISSLIKRANIPVPNLPTIAITGSKGKGSTSIYASYLLSQHGEKVGLLTSPNYRSHRERIRIDGFAISQADYIRIVTQLAPHIIAHDEAISNQKYISPNGIFLCVALQYWHEQGITARVLEAGRGGRFDDIAVITHQITVITNIYHEHLANFGTTQQDIAWHKVGLLHPNNTLITGHIPEDCQDVIQQEVTHKQASWEQLNHDFSYIQHENIITITNNENTTTHTLNTSATYQAHNLTLAHVAVSQLLQQPTPSTHISVNTFGRVQHIPHEKTIFLDGAINRESAQHFLDSTLPHSPPSRVLITTLPHDKDYAGVFDVFLPHVDALIMLELGHGYLHYDVQAKHYAEQLNIPIHTVDSLANAISQANTYSSWWIVGTQSLVRETLDYFDVNLESLYGD